MNRTPHLPLGCPPESRTLVLFACLALILAFDLVLLGPYALVHFHDSFDVEALNYLAQGRIFRDFGLTGWYPDVCAGAPSFVGHRAPYSPLNILAGYLPLWSVHAGLRVLLLAMLGQGTFRMLSGFFGLDRNVSLWGAIPVMVSALAFSNCFVFNFAFPLCFVWSLELSDGGLSRSARLGRLAALLGVCLISYPVMSAPYFPALHLGLILAFGRAPGLTARRIAGCLALWTAYLLLFAPYLYSLLDYTPFIQREYHYEMNGVWPALVFTLKSAAQVVYDDQPAFGLLLFGLPLLRTSRRLGLTLLFVLVPALVLGLSHSPFRAWVAGTFLLKLDLGNIVRLLQISVPLFGVLALGERLGRPARRTWKLEALAAVAVCGLLAPAYIVLQEALVLGLGLCALALSGPGSGWGPGPGAGSGQDPQTARKRAWVLAGLTLGLAGAVLFNRQIVLLKHSHIPYRQGYGNQPELQRLADREKGRALRVACPDLHPSVAQEAGFEVVEQKSVLFNKYFKRVMKGVVRPRLDTSEKERRFDDQWYHLFLTDLNIHENYALAFNPGTPLAASQWSIPLLELLNVDYLLASKPIEGLEDAADLLFHSESAGLPVDFLRGTKADRFYRLPLWVYRLKHPMERGFLARPSVFPSRDQAMAAMEAATRQELRTRAYFGAEDAAGQAFDMAQPGDTARPGPTATEGDSSQPGSGAQSEHASRSAQAPAESPGQVSLRTYTPDFLAFEGVAQSACVLVVSNNFDPHWTATVDGRAAPLLRADEAFQAVPLAPGPFRVELAYAHPLVWKLHWLSLAGLALFLLPLLGRGPGAGRSPGAISSSDDGPLSGTKNGGNSPEKTGGERDGTRSVGTESGTGDGPGRATGQATGRETGQATGRARVPAWTAPLASAAMTLAWAVPFYFTICLKPSAVDRPVLYILWTGSAMGLALGWWAKAAARR